MRQVEWQRSKEKREKKNPVNRSIDNGEFTIEYLFRFKKFNTQAPIFNVQRRKPTALAQIKSPRLSRSGELFLSLTKQNYLK
jgi:hypothetical protein